VNEYEVCATGGSRHQQLKIFNTKVYETKNKLCPTGANTCARPLFCCREGDLDILKMYLHNSKHSKLLKLDELCMAITSEMKKYENNSQSRSQG